MVEPGLILRERLPRADRDGMIAVREVWGPFGIDRQPHYLETLFYVRPWDYASRREGWT